uniref:Uncharacterized protein n=1 Tax=Tanacetum cinerariifolium TaxID=118510 RepID=A0A699QF56_TANCI|nr:hypothetical protein [Tanacetum cinerariifolium]
MWWLVMEVAKMDEVRQWWGDGVRCAKVGGDEMVLGWGRGGRRLVVVVWQWRDVGGSVWLPKSRRRWVRGARI